MFKKKEKTEKGNHYATKWIYRSSFKNWKRKYLYDISSKSGLGKITVL